MYDYDRRTAAKVNWTEKGGKWVAHVNYANGEEHTWVIDEVKDGQFVAHVNTGKTGYKRKKVFDSLEAAQRYGAKFIDKANGNQMLKDVLDKDFVKG
jgi:hypothetical protein